MPASDFRILPDMAIPMFSEFEIVIFCVGLVGAFFGAAIGAGAFLWLSHPGQLKCCEQGTHHLSGEAEATEKSSVILPRTVTFYCVKGSSVIHDSQSCTYLRSSDRLEVLKLCKRCSKTWKSH